MKRWATGFPLFLLAASLLQAGDPIRLVYDEWPPYAAQNLPGHGLSVDVATTLLTRLGYTVTATSVTSAESENGLRDGRYDINPATWKTAEREQYMVYSQPYISNRLVVVTSMRRINALNTLDDLKGLRVGLAKGYGYPDSIKNAQGFTPVYSDSLEASLLDLVEGKINATIGDSFVVQYLDVAVFNSGAQDFNCGNTVLAEKHLHFVISKKRPDAAALADKINAELIKMQGDGTYNDLLQKHGMVK